MMRLNLASYCRTWMMACAVGVLLFGSAAYGQAPRPFRISGSGTAPNGLTPEVGATSIHLATGQATHLGRYQGSGALELYSLDEETFSGTFGSAVPFTFMAANGDKLVTHYGNTDFGANLPGTYQITVLDVTPESELIVSAIFVAEFVVQPDESTGRFKGATGSWIMEARTAPFILGSPDPLPYVWQGQGTIVMPRPQSKSK